MHKKARDQFGDQAEDIINDIVILILVLALTGGLIAFIGWIVAHWT